MKEDLTSPIKLRNKLMLVSLSQLTLLPPPFPQCSNEYDTMVARFADVYSVSCMPTLLFFNV